MKGDATFVRLLLQFGKVEAIRPLVEDFGPITRLPDDAPEHAVLEVVAGVGPRAARGVWKFLQDLPNAVAAGTPAQFVIGCDPLDRESDGTLAKWDGWLKDLYRMAIDPPPTKADGSAFKYRDRLLGLVYEDLDGFLMARIRFWLKESGAQEDREYIARRGRAVTEL